MAAPVDISFPNIHPRVGVQTLSVDPEAFKIQPASTFPMPYCTLIYWPRAIGAWLQVETESVSARSRARLGSQPADLQAAIKLVGASNSALAQQVVNQEWVNKHRFAVGPIREHEAIKLTFRVETNHEKFVKFAADPGPGGLVVTLMAVYFHGSVGQPEGQMIRLLLEPGTAVSMSSALLGLDLGNTDTTAALLKPFAAGTVGPRKLTEIIPMLTARVVPGHSSTLGASIPRGQPIASELRFDLFRSWIAPGITPQGPRSFPDLENFPDDDRPNAVDYAVGEPARKVPSPARNVVLGAKRMASHRPLPPRPGESRPRYSTRPVSAPQRIIPESSADPTEPIDLPDSIINLDVRTPLELLACRVFQHFREDQKAWPAKVALTYPTTYTRYELQVLRRAVQKGWLRMQAAGQSGEYDPPSGQAEQQQRIRELQAVVQGALDLDNQDRDPVIQLLLDEASAAAFFHIYRKIFEEIHGGLAAFRYLYEHGLNMLLYDCGGGTTDIALVRALVEPDARTLRITVLRRSGVRTFGGDDITRQVCRLLKAKLACALTTEPQKFPTQPVVPTKAPEKADAWAKLGQDLEKFIADVALADPDDLLVPTKTPPGQTPSGDRRAAALDLWRIGEDLKRVLAGEKPAPSTQPEKLEPGKVYWPLDLERATNKLTMMIYPGESQQVAAVGQQIAAMNQQIAAVKKKLAAVTLSRIEIDALIREPVMRSIANCNALIREVFEATVDGTQPPHEVHWVVASGNAVKYPLLKDLLRNHLAVSFLDDPKQFTFDADEAKDATAKGAVLALAAMESRGQQIDLRFDSDLCDRLPFDVGFRNLMVNRPETIFAEHTHYRVLQKREPVKIPMDAVADSAAASEPGSVAARNFLLLRQFPGDAGFQPFLGYEFPEGIKGSFLKVSYDDKYEYEFRVVDGEGTEGIPTDLASGDTYVAPALRGEI